MMIPRSKNLLHPIRSYIDARYPGWNLDAALRYLPVADYLRDRRPRWTLDVGSGGAGLSRYADQRVIEIDRLLPPGGPQVPSRTLRASASALPFRDRSVQAVVCLDLLEHLPAEDRRGVLSELLRVAGPHLVLGFPSGPEAERAERALDRLHRRRSGYSHPWLGQHLAHGLPDSAAVAAELRALAGSSGRRAQIREAGNVNLRLWFALYFLYLAGGPRARRAIGTTLLVLIPVLRHCHFGKTYRRILYVRLDADL